MELGKFILFIHGKLTGNLNPEEQDALSEWLNDKENAKVERDVNKIWTASTSYKKDYHPPLEKSWDNFSAKVASERKPAPSIQIITRKRLTFAATILFLILAGTLWWNTNQQSESMIIVTTVGGETQLITLPDATKVVLNQHSTLSYPGQWEGRPLRYVQLSGEAYFEVTPNPQQPFQIETPKAKIQVLGTAFNLRAYLDEKFTEVAVTEGQVYFARKDDQDSMTLNQNQIGQLQDQKKEILAPPLSAFNAQSWRTNQLSFRDTPMAEITKTLERHFDIDIRFENVAISRCSYTSNFIGENLEEILTVLKVSLSLDIEQTGEQTYLFSGGNCGGIN